MEPDETQTPPKHCDCEDRRFLGRKSGRPSHLLFGCDKDHHVPIAVHRRRVAKSRLVDLMRLERRVQAAEAAGDMEAADMLAEQAGRLFDEQDQRNRLMVK